MVFKNGKAVSTIQGADSKALLKAVEQLEVEGGSDGAGNWEAGSSSSGWLGSDLPRGYIDVTSQVDVLGLDLLNFNSDFGVARTLFDVSKPSVLDSGKGKGNTGAGETKKDWVESDTDEQLMLFIPFQATLKIHTLHITSLPPKPSEGEAQDEIPMRPKTIQIYSNRAHVLGFEEAEDVPATQAITLRPQDWDEKTGTAKIELRFVKFQNVSSLVVFVLDGDGEGEKVRVDRLRIVGETGEKRDLGKLEKIGDQAGE
ncbi:Thioredoxin-like protein 1 [Pseudocyphellaria aurata]|nr:Thioredoxin-like protein 1 [Pseudocyphellaria aurata]